MVLFQVAIDERFSIHDFAAGRLNLIDDKNAFVITFKK